MEEQRERESQYSAMASFSLHTYVQPTTVHMCYSRLSVAFVTVTPVDDVIGVLDIYCAQGADKKLTLLFTFSASTKYLQV